MKTFQKITLAAAISAAPFASQALEALDDSVLAATTGQAGVTIEIELGATGITIDSVTYTDTATMSSDATPVSVADIDTTGNDVADTHSGGSVVLENISITGLGKMTQTIDVTAGGDLFMTTSAPTSDVVIGLGNNALDTTGAKSGLLLEAVDGSQSEIINNLNMTVALGSSTTTIKNLGTAASAGLGALSGAGVTGSHATDTSSMAIQLSSSLEVKDLDLGVFGYTNAQANVIGDTKASEYATAWTAAAGNATQQAALATAYGDGGNDGTLDGADLTTLKNSIATGSAIQVTDVSVTGIGGGAMTMDQTIWAVGGDASEAGSTAGVYIQMGAMNADINVGGIAIGGSSIGSVAISGLRMAGMTQRIYGH
jgi:hypothetical protein